MGFFDRARSLLGLEKGAAKDAGTPPAASRAEKRKNKDGRPPLPEVAEGAQATLEDVLAARDRGATDEARAILVAIDKGQGLRTVMRAALALEAGDLAEVEKLLPAVKAERPAWQLRLQVAAALPVNETRQRLLDSSVALGAPAWSLAWLRALSGDESERLVGLVDLLFEDPALARTVASRDLKIADVRADNDAIRRYAGFAHGRDIIERFGASALAALLDRIDGRP